MTKEEDQAFREANSMGEERCGDCLHWERNIYSDLGIGYCYKKGGYNCFDSDECWCVPSEFESNRGSSLGETKHAKEEEE